MLKILEKAFQDKFKFVQAYIWVLKRVKHFHEFIIHFLVSFTDWWLEELSKEQVHEV